MAARKSQIKSTSRAQKPGSPQNFAKPHPEHPTVSGRWLLIALAISLPAAALCTWGVFCLLFWQGSWQLLYHPTSSVSRNPSNIGLAYDQISFATTNAGVAQIQGWWIPAASAHFTALYLHGEAGNLGDTLPVVGELQRAGLNILAFDYRGYGKSQFQHPSEASWLQDANWALEYLTGTRHIDPHSIVIIGDGLGANLALEVAAAHQELAGVVLVSPLKDPVRVIFDDGRARIVPAHWLIHDRYDLEAPAATLRIPSLWIVKEQSPAQDASSEIQTAYVKVTVQKTRAALTTNQGIGEPLERWLTLLPR